MNKEKVIKVAIVIVSVAVPFGLVTVGGYYGYKRYKENKAKKLAEQKLLENDTQLKK